MAYTTDMQQAANRHYEDGRSLQHAKRFDNAGYHYGFAAECALKHSLQEIGVRNDDESIWKHFPTLTGLANLAISSRRAGPIRTVLARKSFMQGWTIDMRYAKNGSISPDIVEKWRSDANAAIGLLY